MSGRRVGIRDLKTHASQILHEVREHEAEYVVTHRGEPVGILVPFREGRLGLSQQTPHLDDGAWNELESLGREIARKKGAVSATDALAAMRR